MTIKQAIKNASVIKVKTANGIRVTISKKEARAYVDFCNAHEYDCQPDITYFGTGKVMIILA